jgi:hypothetical protein
MNTCPHCKRAAMTLGQKSALGPGRVVACKSCGKPVAAHWIAVFTALPAFVGGFAYMKYGAFPIGIPAILGGLVAMALLQTFCVPLVRGDR